MLYCYRKFDSKIIRLITNDILSSRLGVWGFNNVSIRLQDSFIKFLSQESIYIYPKQKGSNRDYFSMIDVIYPKKCNQEMSEVIFFKKRHQWFLISFDFWPLVLADNKFATAVKETLLFISNFPKFVSLTNSDNTSY